MAKQISTEEESNLKRQARRRLIGAVVLVLAIVVILPMIFDSEPSPTTAHDIELRIPDKDRAPAYHPDAATPPVADVALAVSAAAASAVTGVPVSAVSAAPVADQPTRAVQAESIPKAEPKPIPETKPKVESGAGTKSAPQSGWVVQVGAYSNADTARQMYAKLSKEGYHVYTEKAGSMVRVRVGSYPTREAAEKIKHKLEALGLHPNVVNLE
ncbi:MAG: SPOR domain-containing protein [Sideroxyarcus sp.]|nr:SPOR domain-containing protein [Sideroxyarcus sp.]